MLHQKLSAQVHERIIAEAKGAQDEAFQRLLVRQREARRVHHAGQPLTEALFHRVMQDEQLRKEYPKDSHLPSEQLIALRKRANWQASRSLDDSPAARAAVARPLRLLDDPRAPLAEDRNLQFFVPPYADQWSSHNQSGNAEVQNLLADRSTGNFGYFIGSADGSAWCGAGVWVQFVPTMDTMVQVRAYTPFDYQYDLDSQYGYTAHDSGGFGIFVLSWNFDGTGRFNDLDHRYNEWSDGTGWWEHHTNPSAPDSDFGNAFVYGNEARYFSASSNRVYLALIWGFGGSDAGGGFFGNAISASDLNASARFVVIGEQ